MRLVPPSATADARRVLAVRGLRAFTDGYTAVLLPLYLAALGFSTVEIGAIGTATLLGSALLTLILGLWLHHIRRRLVVLGAALLMAGTGLGFAGLTEFWPLMAIAFVGTLNPSSGDVSVFYALEQTLIAESVAERDRTALFARYSLVGSLVSAIGALASGIVDWLAVWIEPIAVMRAMFVLFALVGVASFALYWRLSPAIERIGSAPQAALGPSKRRVYGLAALFSLDSFAGGLSLNTFIALWLFERFQVSATTAGTIFFFTGAFAAVSYLASERLANRIGLINTMVFTHLPSNLFLIAAAFMPTWWGAAICLVLRSALSQMDVPARASYVMAIVTPPERPAAASLTAVPRSLATTPGPYLAGALLSLSSFGWPLVIAGALKVVYDLALLRQFARIKPPEEAG